MATPKKSNKKLVLAGLVVALVFVVLGTFVLSYAYETFDMKAEELGAEEQPIFEAPFADYTLGGSDNQWVALIVGVAATFLLFLAGIAAAKVFQKKKSVKP
ncbi:MAG: hypothetical protein ACM3UY_07260 [Methanocella sp.]|jgi:hypothetical protein